QIICFLDLRLLDAVRGWRIKVDVLAVRQIELSRGCDIVPTHLAGLAQLQHARLGAPAPPLHAIGLLKLQLDRLRVVIPILDTPAGFRQNKVGGEDRREEYEQNGKSSHDDKDVWTGGHDP